MPGKADNPTNFWQELKRRKVIRRNMVYAASGFVILELVSIIAEPFGLPDWTLKLVFVLLCIGFVISIILSWFYDFTPDGIEKMKSANEFKEAPPEKQSKLIAWKIVTYISVVIIVGFIIFNFAIGPKRAEYLTDLEKSFAVLPFENMSVDEEYSYMGDAITDEIILELQKIKGFDRILSRTSTMQYKDNRPTIPEIAEKLGVNFIIDGSIQRHKEDVSIRVQVYRAEHEDHIWGDEYDGKWEDIFSIQDEMALKVANELKTVLSSEEMEQIGKQPTENLEAYDLYLKGRYFWNRGANYNKSIECYKRALEIDPDYALAYAGMAATFNSYGFGGQVPRKDVIPQAKKAAMKALEIDNTIGEAHAELAHARHFYDWDWAGAEMEFKRALEVNPNYARGHEWFGWLLTDVGRFDEALQEFKRGLELDPFNPQIWVGIGRQYYFARDYDKAIEEYRKVLELFPNSRYARSELALALSHKGLHNRAIEEYPKITFYPPWDWYLGYINGAAGKKEEALEILNKYLELSNKKFVSPAGIAFIYIGLGKKDKAFEWLEKAYEQRGKWLSLIKVEPMYDSLRSDPRFQDLVERMNFPD